MFHGESGGNPVRQVSYCIRIDYVRDKSFPAGERCRVARAGAAMLITVSVASRAGKTLARVVQFATKSDEKLAPEAIVKAKIGP